MCPPQVRVIRPDRSRGSARACRRVVVGPGVNQHRGVTWHAPAPDRGFVIDPDVYGYGKGFMGRDNSIRMVYIRSGGHRPADAATNAVLTIRFRPLPELDGIEILPPAGR